MTNIKQPTSSATETILAQNAKAIRALGKRVIGDIIEIGRLLTDAKRIAGHGNWLPWLEREFGWEETTARRFMDVHSLSLKSGNLQDLELPVSGLYLLAKPSTPEEAREAVIERAENGERLSVKDIRNQIDEARTAEPAQAEGAFPIYGGCAGGRVVTERTSIKAKADRAAVKQPKPMPDVRAAADRAEGLIADQIKASPSTVGEERNELMHPSALRSGTEAPVKTVMAEQAVRKLRDQIVAVVATAIGVSPMQPIIDTIFDIAADFAERNDDVKKFVQRVRQRIDAMELKVDQGWDAGCAPKIDLRPVPAAPSAPAMATVGDGLDIPPYLKRA